jgi:hypothetical protein
MQMSPHPSRVLRGIFGVLAIVIALAIIAWIGYNEFVETFATAHGLSLVGAVRDGPGPGEYRLVLAAQSPTAQSI